MKHYFHYLLLISALVLCGCQKDTSEGGSTQEQPSYSISVSDKTLEFRSDELESKTVNITASGHRMGIRDNRRKPMVQSDGIGRQAKSGARNIRQGEHRTTKPHGKNICHSLRCQGQCHGYPDRHYTVRHPREGPLRHRLAGRYHRGEHHLERRVRGNLRGDLADSGRRFRQKQNRSDGQAQRRLRTAHGRSGIRLHGRYAGRNGHRDSNSPPQNPRYRKPTISK